MQAAKHVHHLDLKEAAELLNSGPRIISRKLYECGVFIRKEDGRKVAAPRYVREHYFVNQLKSFNRELPGHGYKLEYYEKVLITEKGINLIRQILENDKQKLGPSQSPNTPAGEG